MSPSKSSRSLRKALAGNLVHPRAHVLAAECPSRLVLGHITSRWGVLVLVVLLDGTHRFSQLRREIGGVSEKMLAQTLDALATDGMVLRVAHQVVPPHVEYSLTPLGRQAAERLELLVDWIEDNFPLIRQAQDEAALAAAQASRKA